MVAQGRWRLRHPAWTRQAEVERLRREFGQVQLAYSRAQKGELGVQLPELEYPAAVQALESSADSADQVGLSAVAVRGKHQVDLEGNLVAPVQVETSQVVEGHIAFHNLEGRPGRQGSRVDRPGARIERSGWGEEGNRMVKRVEVEGLAIVGPEEAVGNLGVVAEVVEVRHLERQGVVVQPVDASGQYITQGSA